MSAYQSSPNSQFNKVVRFRNQKGCLGLSSSFLLQILNFYKLGTPPPKYIHHPYDYDDFSRIGLLIICRPELEPYLQIVKYCSLEWYNIIENWDLLIKYFFFQTQLSNSQLTSLLTGIMSIQQSDVDFFWPLDQNKDQTSKKRSSSWMTEMNEKKKDLFVHQNKKSHKLSETPKVEQIPPKVEQIPPKVEQIPPKVEQIPPKVEQIPSKVEPKPEQEKDSYSLIEEDSKEIAHQLSSNLNVLDEMEITSEVAKLLIPQIIKKFKKNVNISWSWNDGKEGHHGDWQDIYDAGDDTYDIPHQNGVVGYLEVNLPISPDLESKGIYRMLKLMTKKDRENQKLTEEEEISRALEMIKFLE